MNRGRVNFVLGNFAQAAADLQRGLSLDSADVGCRALAALARLRLAQDDASDWPPTPRRRIRRSGPRR